MIRVLIFILVAFFFAALITLLASVNGRVEAEAFNVKFDMHSGFAFGLIIALFILAVYLTVVIKDLKGAPARMKARHDEKRRTHGIEALTRGLEAVAVGDASGAQHHAKVARRNLDDSSLTRLLTAQAAQLAGDEKAAEENFNAMLAAPETEFLGLRGLYVQAMRKDDKAAARGYADRAFRLRSNARWAFDSVVDLGLDRGAWGETRAAIATARHNDLISAEKARRGEAALLTADAYAAQASGEEGAALEEAEAALKLEPGFTPAAVLCARIHGADGRRPKAAKILEQAFAEAPHPALAHAHSALYAEEPVEKRAEQLKRLADRRPTAREAKLAYARRHILLGEYDQAVAILEPLLIEAATARECLLMAEAAAGDSGPDVSEAAKRWRARALLARRETAPGADGEFHFTRAGWASLVREYMAHGRLAPPPLEDAPSGVTADEMKLLSAPPEPLPVEPVDTPVVIDNIEDDDGEDGDGEDVDTGSLDDDEAPDAETGPAEPEDAETPPAEKQPAPLRKPDETQS